MKPNHEVLCYISLLVSSHSETSLQNWIKQQVLDLSLLSLHPSSSWGLPCSSFQHLHFHLRAHFFLLEDINDLIDVGAWFAYHSWKYVATRSWSGSHMDAWVDLEKIWVDLGRIDLARVDLMRVDFESWSREMTPFRLCISIKDVFATINDDHLIELAEFFPSWQYPCMSEWSAHTHRCTVVGRIYHV